MKVSTSTGKTSNRGVPANVSEVPIVRNLEGVRPQRALALPLLFTAALASLSLLPTVQVQVRLAQSLWGAALALLVWNAAADGLRLLDVDPRPVVVRVRVRYVVVLDAA